MVRRSVALLVGLASGCGGPVGVKAPPGESSSEGSGGTTSGTTSGATTSSGSEADPSRPQPPPFELPEGCGDGVIVPGQYDCFLPVSIDWVKEELGGSPSPLLHPLDVDGDGRDEVVAVRAGWSTAVLRWESGELHLGPILESPQFFGYVVVESRWDWNGDRRPDLTLTMTDDRAPVAMYPSWGAEGLGEQTMLHILPDPQWTPDPPRATGRAVPIDVDADRTPELLVSMQVGGFGSANPAEALVLFRQKGATWEPVGEAHPWGPCGSLDAVARGDFDGDGDEDIAVLDNGQACDGYPGTYDPEWYRVYVLLTNAEEGTLELGGWYSAGGLVWDPKIWAEDVTADGHLDLVVRISKRVPCDSKSGTCMYWSVAVMRGLGNGSFEEGNPIALDPIFHSYIVQALMDVDGDGTREWMVRPHEGRPWLIPFDLSKEGIAPLVALGDPEAGWVTGFGAFVGDVNADGVDDYSAGLGLSGDPAGLFLMVSAP